LDHPFIDKKSILKRVLLQADTDDYDENTGLATGLLNQAANSAR